MTRQASFISRKQLILHEKREKRVKDLV